jgi:cyclophilin family peptidyl-prolyl cis-trans isomerase
MLNDIRIVIHTAKGDIDVTLFPDKAPLAAEQTTGRMEPSPWPEV